MIATVQTQEQKDRYFHRRMEDEYLQMIYIRDVDFMMFL